VKLKISSTIVILLFLILNISCTTTKTYTNINYPVDGKIIYCDDDDEPAADSADILLSENDILVSYSLKWNAKGDYMETSEFFMNMLLFRMSLHYRVFGTIKYHDKLKKFRFNFRTNKAYHLEALYKDEIKIALFESIKFSHYQIKITDPISTDYVNCPFRAFDIINLNDYDSGYSNGYTVYINEVKGSGSLSPILNNERAELIIKNCDHQQLARVFSVNDFLDSYEILADEVSDDEIKLLTLCAIVYRAMYSKLK